MIHVLSSFKGLWKSKKLHTDHWCFRLHYRFTFLFLIIAFVIVSTKQYAGEPIKCSKDTREYSPMVEVFCYVTSTYTVKTAMNLTPAEGAPHPGIYPSQVTDEYRYHTYYQWVGYILLVQAIFFYFPHWMWKIVEGGKLMSLLERDTMLLQKEDQVKIRTLIVEHLRSRWTKDRFFIYKYLFCEILCLVNIIGQMTLLDSVFENEFFSFGFEVMSYFRNGFSGVSPLVRMFPRVTSCTYRHYGMTGKVVTESVLCVLAVNVINEKIFLFLWFWFMFLTVITFFTLTVKIIVFSVPAFRLNVLCMRFPSIRGEDFKTIVDTGNLSNYLFIYLLGQNMDELNFYDIIDVFATVQRGKVN